jgi:phage shock protein PspC (stress-responsive transcriptional regulator)
MSEHTLHTPIARRLERSRSDKWLAGVSGGLGRYFDVTPAVFRLGFVVLTLLSGFGILVYVAAVLVIPREGEETSMAEDILKKRRDHPARLVALGLVAVAILSVLASAHSWPSSGTAWFLVLVAGLILLWTSRRRGVIVALTSFLALIVVASIAAVAVAFAWFDVSLGDGVGNRTYTPSSVADVGNGYKLGVGTLTVDLSTISATQPTHVNAHVGIGQLRIVVPHAAKVSVDSHVKAGSIDSLDRHEDGTNVHVDTAAGAPLTIDAEVGAGHIQVDRAP